MYSNKKSNILFFSREKYSGYSFEKLRQRFQNPNESKLNPIHLKLIGSGLEPQ